MFFADFAVAFVVRATDLLGVPDEDVVGVMALVVLATELKVRHSVLATVLVRALMKLCRRLAKSVKRV